MSPYTRAKCRFSSGTSLGGVNTANKIPKVKAITAKTFSSLMCRLIFAIAVIFALSYFGRIAAEYIKHDSGDKRKSHLRACRWLLAAHDPARLLAGTFAGRGPCCARQTGSSPLDRGTPACGHSSYAEKPHHPRKALHR